MRYGCFSSFVQVKFEPAPIFVVLPHTSVGVGGRRWRLWHSQLSSLGKVYPIALPDHLTNPCQVLSLQVLVEEMMLLSLARVQEVCVDVCRWSMQDGVMRLYE